MTDRLRLLAIVALILLGSSRFAAAQLQVEGTPRWGFDGKARTDRFNLLTVNLFNNSERPWEGDLLLEAQTGLRSVDVPLLHPGLFVEPYGQRRIQFFVFLPYTTDYVLKWGRGPRDRFRIDEPQTAPAPAVVELAEEALTTSGMRGMVRFPETDFPASGAGLEGLGTVLLNHVPRWSDSQRLAFRDWLHAGGKLHLYHEAGGEFPRFPRDLAELNQPSDAFSVGSGRVLRHASSIQQAENDVREPAASATGRYSEWQTTTNLLAVLREMTIPEHNWPMIYLMAIAYLVLLFPGCWLLGRRRGDYRITYAAVLGVVFVFSVGFHAVGRRGYGETTSLNSVALARPASDGRLLLTQWSNLFVTAGGQYLVRHQAEGLVYSSGQLNEPVLGRAFNRPQGAMAVDVPAFSARGMVHAGVLPAGALQVDVTKLDDQDNRLKELELRLLDGRSWPDDPLFEGFALHRDRLYPLSQREDGTLVALTRHSPSDPVRTLSQYLDPNQWSAFRYGWRQQSWTTEELYRKSLSPLIAHDLGIASQDERDTFTLPLDELRVYLFTPMPDEFLAGGDTSSQQSGRVLHVIKLAID